MEETYLVLMLRDEKTGFLEKEINAYKIKENEEYIVNIFAVENQKIDVHIKIDCNRECEDWEFDAIYDYYDENVFNEIATSFHEVEGCFNPTWEIVFPYIQNNNDMESFIAKILRIHKNELDDVYETIGDKKNDYL